MESDSKFQLFVQAIFQDALNNPDQLKDIEEVWDKEWDELLSGVTIKDKSATEKSCSSQPILHSVIF